MIMAVMIAACSTDDVVISPDVGTTYADSVSVYFKEVALGFEFGSASRVTRKWRSPLRIFVGGQPTTDILDELDPVIEEINALTLDGFQIQLTQDSSASNFYIYFGSGAAYGKLYPGIAHLTDGNWGLFSVFFNGLDEIYQAHMYVDIFRADLPAQRHLLREELTQSLGLARDSFRYPQSIFQQNWTTTTMYAQIDRHLIQALYHPAMTTGLNCDQVRPVLDQILAEIL